MTEMNDNILVTILMSVYNVNNNYLIEAIESIIGQTYKKLEFLIFDDNTSESNKNILHKYATKDCRIRVITNEEKLGLTKNLVRGVEICKGQYICRQDADDISHEDRIEKQLFFMEKHLDIAVLGTNYTRLENGRLIFPKITYGTKLVRTKLLFENCIMHSSVMIRKAFLKAHKLNYNCSVEKSQDYDLWTRIIMLGNIDILKERCCILRIHEGQITKKSWHAQKQYFLDAAERYLRNSLLPEINDQDALCYKRFLAMSTEDYMKTIQWAIKLFFTKFDATKYDTKYIKCFLIKRIFRLTAKNLFSFFFNVKFS